MLHMCGFIFLAEVLGMYLLRFWRRLMWSQHLAAVLDQVGKVLSGLVPLVTGKIYWRPAEDSSSFTIEYSFCRIMNVMLHWIELICFPVGLRGICCNILDIVWLFSFAFFVILSIKLEAALAKHIYIDVIEMKMYCFYVDITMYVFIWWIWDERRF